MSAYRSLARPWLFRMDPEGAHERVVSALEAAGRVPLLPLLLRLEFRFDHPTLSTVVAGLRFPNPVGLAAGFDKDCRLGSILPSLGFGFVELGTVTPRPQSGNPRPRVFRIPESEALLNRLGFNNQGAEAAARRLSRLGAHKIPVGINLGMNADTPPEKAHQDYASAFNALKDFGDYFTINVSSPNTGGLRDLQERLKLERILTAIRLDNREKKPIFVKLAPDLDSVQLAGLIPLLMQEADGVVVSNTTISREGVPDRWADARGGLSGAPLKDLSTRIIQEVHRMSEGRLPIIGVGGVSNAEDAYQKLRAGASLVQLYTGLVYHGPGLIREINMGLVRLLRDHGIHSVAEAVGRSRDAALSTAQ